MLVFAFVFTADAWPSPLAGSYQWRRIHEYDSTAYHLVRIRQPNDTVALDSTLVLNGATSYYYRIANRHGTVAHVAATAPLTRTVLNSIGGDSVVIGVTAGAYVTSVSATAPLTSSGGATPSVGVSIGLSANAAPILNDTSRTATACHIKTGHTKASAGGTAVLYFQPVWPDTQYDCTVTQTNNVAAFRISGRFLDHVVAVGGGNGLVGFVCFGR